MNFILESISLFLQKWEVELDVAVTKLVQVPDLEEAIVHSVRFTEFEEKKDRKGQFEDKGYLTRLGEVKTAFWKIVMCLWKVQCMYKVSTDYESQDIWTIRELAVNRGLKIQVKKEERKNMNKSSHFYQMYFSKRGEKLSTLMSFLSRALIDKEFQRFIEKLPKIFQYYAAAQREAIYDRQIENVETIIMSKYKNAYLQFRTIFGLKLNYTPQLVKDKTQFSHKRIDLVKRFQKKMFKYARDRLKEFQPLEGRPRTGSVS